MLIFLPYPHPMDAAAADGARLMFLSYCGTRKPDLVHQEPCQSPPLSVAPRFPPQSLKISSKLIFLEFHARILGWFQIERTIAAQR